MKLTYKEDHFELRCLPKHERFAKKAGFFHHANKGYWYSERPRVAARLARFADDKAREIIYRTMIDFDPFTSPLPYKKGLTLLRHQPYAARFALSRNRSYLALKPGLGKTAIAATICNARLEPAIYICPPSLVQNTINEFRTWGSAKLRVSSTEKDIFERSDIVVVPDSKLSDKNGCLEYFDHLYHRFKLRNPHVIVDEAHRFKSMDSIRTKNLFGVKGRNGHPGILDAFPRMTFMSGTLMPNRAMELWPVLFNCAHETIGFMTQNEFGLRYCGGFQDRFGWQYPESTNMGDLSRRIRPFRLKMEKSVLGRPGKIEEVFVLNADPGRELQNLEAAIGHSEKNEEQLIKRMTGGKSDIQFATYRRQLGLSKVKAIIELAKEFLQDNPNESLLIFAVHKEVIKELSEGLREFLPLVITGETPMRARQPIVKEFQDNINRRLFMGNIQAAGIGFTLTKAWNVWLAEPSWVPGDNEQAGDRADRIGQTETVVVKYLVLKDSMDKKIIEANLRKRKAIDII